jgi:iron complex outermembrane receptor protein
MPVREVLMSQRRFNAVGMPALALLPSLIYPFQCLAQPAEAPTLPSVLVTATRYEQDPLVTPAYVTVVTRDQMESANVATVNEAISRIGGLATRTSLSGGNELTIDPMGFGDAAGSNLIVLIDGIPIREGDATEIRLSGIPIESVERIEIQRSSGSVLYGGGATGGVINIITKASSGTAKEGNYGSVYAGRGPNATNEYRVTGQRVHDGLDLALGFSDRNSAGFREHSANSDRSLNLSLRYTGELGRAGMSLSSENNFAQTPGSLTEQQFRADRSMAQPDSVSANTRINTDSTRLAAFLERELAGILWRIDASVRSRDMDAVAVKKGAASAFGFRGNDHFLSVGGQTTSDTAVGQNRLVFGIEYGNWSQLRNYPPPLTFGNYQLNFGSTSFYIKDDLDVKRLGLRLTAGYRIDQNERSQLGLSFGDQVDNRYTRSAWELGASKDIDSENSVYARWATSFRFANIDEFGSSYNLDGTARVLLPQTSRDHEIGWKRTLGARGRMDVRLYRSELNNELAFRNDLGIDVYNALLESNINLLPTRRQGVDVDLSYPVTDRLLVASSVGIRDARFRSGDLVGNRVPMSAREVVSIRGEYSFDERQRFGAMGRWISSQFVTLDFENQYRMPGYAVADLYYQYRFGNFELSLKALNIFDRYYYSYATRVSPTASAAAYTGVYPDQGRSLWVALRLRF